MSEHFRQATDEEFEQRYCDESYDLLVGPDDWECLLTEPEDRRWSRDLRPVIQKLNEQRAEINRLNAMLDKGE